MQSVVNKKVGHTHENTSLNNRVLRNLGRAIHGKVTVGRQCLTVCLGWQHATDTVSRYYDIIFDDRHVGPCVQSADIVASKPYCRLYSVGPPCRPTMCADDDGPCDVALIASSIAQKLLENATFMHMWNIEYTIYICDVFDTYLWDGVIIRFVLIILKFCCCICV